jgi:uncharacterized protein
MAKIGTIGWVDLTVPDADALKEFYQDVVGWTTSAFDMGGYNDYCMNVPNSEDTVAGVCHARGSNANQPAQWMIYINVANLDESMEKVTARGGKVLNGPRNMPEQGRYCVIQDPAGAVAALFEPVSKE